MCISKPVVITMFLSVFLPIDFGSSQVGVVRPAYELWSCLTAWIFFVRLMRIPCAVGDVLATSGAFTSSLDDLICHERAFVGETHELLSLI